MSSAIHYRNVIQAVTLNAALLLLFFVLPVAAQVKSDSSAVKKDSLAIPNDVVPLDSLSQAIADSLDRIKELKMIDSLDNANFIGMLMRRNYKFDQIPLPPSINLNFTDSAEVTARHLKAIEDYFSMKFDKISDPNLLMVKIAGADRMSTARVRGFPYLQAIKDQYEHTVFVNEYDINEHSQFLNKTFAQKVDVVLDIKTYTAAVASLDTLQFFTIELIADNKVFKPQRIDFQPVRSYIFGQMPWYEREVILSFPRRLDGKDWLKASSLKLVITVKDRQLLFDNETQHVYEFNLIPAVVNIEIDSDMVNDDADSDDNDGEDTGDDGDGFK